MTHLKSVTLDSLQKLYLRESVRKIHPGFENDPIVMAMCFEPHHTIHFAKHEQPTSELVICFACKKIRWDGEYCDFPEKFIPTMATVFTEFGFYPHRDWREAAATTTQADHSETTGE